MKSSRATLRNPDHEWEHETMDAILKADEAKINWSARFQPGDELRITTPILQMVLSKQTKADLAAMDPEYRSRLEREWDEASGITGEPPSPEIVARAKAEWEQTPSRIDGLERSDV